MRYIYNRQVTPPGPFVYVSLQCIQTGEIATDVPAQIDTAADRTVIPGPLVAQLGLIQLGELPVAGLGGQAMMVPTYLVRLAIRSLTPRSILVLAHSGEPYVLLGRDVLNHHRLLLDGPGLALEVD